MTLPEGRLLKVTLTVRLPAKATEEQVEEWLRWETHDNGQISNSNPLYRFEIEPFGVLGFDWTDTEENGREEKKLLEERPDGSKRYSVRYIKERA